MNVTLRQTDAFECGENVVVAARTQHRQSLVSERGDGADARRLQGKEAQTTALVDLGDVDEIGAEPTRHDHAECRAEVELGPVRRACLGERVVADRRRIDQHGEVLRLVVADRVG